MEFSSAEPRLELVMEVCIRLEKGDREKIIILKNKSPKGRGPQIPLSMQQAELWANISDSGSF